MSLSMQPLPEIPTLTVEITRPAFPTGSLYMKTRNELGSFYQDKGFRLVRKNNYAGSIDS